MTTDGMNYPVYDLPGPATLPGTEDLSYLEGAAAMSITVKAASELAKAAHAGQADKAGRPYFEHVAAVRDALAEYGDEAQIAGVLHDALEDTNLTADDLRSVGVPERAVAAIESVSRRDGETYMDMVRRAAADPLGRLVKLADNAHNSREDRLAELDQETAASLRKRYERARELLQPGPSTNPRQEEAS